MWPLVALKFRRQLGRDVVKGKAGRQLPTRHVPASVSASAAWASLDPRLEPDLGEVAAPQQGASPGAMELWKCREVVPGAGSDGVQILHPLLVAPAGCHGDPGAGTSFPRDFAGKGRGRLCFWERGGESGWGSPSSLSLHRKPFHQYSLHKPSLDWADHPSSTPEGCWRWLGHARLWLSIDLSLPE